MMPYRFYLDVYNAKNQLKHTMYSDEEYATSQKAQLAGVFTKLKIMVIQNCTSFKSPIEKKKLHKAYPKFMKHLKNKLTNRNWYSVQHANHSLLKNEIIHTNVKVWELSVDKQMSVGGIVMHPTSFTPFTFTNSGVMESIELNNISAEHIVDWSTITSSNVNSLITLISKHGTCHVTNASIYISGIEIGKGFLYYYIAIAENSINPSRIIHDTIQGDNHVLELLSSTEKQSYVACLLGD
jgi:hypothetical protein